MPLYSYWNTHTHTHTHTNTHIDFPSGVDGKENPSANAGDVRDMGSIPGLGRSPGGGHDNPFQCTSMEHPMDRGGWWATVHRVTNSWTQLK